VTAANDAIAAAGNKGGTLSPEAMSKFQALLADK